MFKQWNEAVAANAKSFAAAQESLASSRKARVYQKPLSNMEIFDLKTKAEFKSVMIELLQIFDIRRKSQLLLKANFNSVLADLLKYFKFQKEQSERQIIPFYLSYRYL